MNAGRSELASMAEERKGPATRGFLSGAYRDRTGDLRLAREVRYIPPAEHPASGRRASA
jgi:hypothetical protein